MYLLNAKIVSVVMCLLVLLSACEKNKPDEDIDFQFQQGIWLINEGNFNSGLGSITYIDTGVDTLVENVFERVNGRKLGDVVQSLYFEEERMYIVVNNSQKIEVVDKKDAKSVGTITSLHSPRYIEKWGTESLLVSNFRSPYLQVVNRNTLQVTDSIAIPTANQATCWTEQLLVIEQELWIANMKDGQLQIVKEGEKMVSDSVAVAVDPNSMVLDREGYLWVMSGGGFCPVCETPALTKIDPRRKEVLQTWLFEGEGTPSSLVIDAEGQHLLYLYQGAVYKMNIGDDGLPTSALATFEGRNIYRLSLTDGKLWAADAVNYLQQGSVLQLNIETGALEKQYKGGFIPSSVYAIK